MRDTTGARLRGRKGVLLRQVVRKQEPFCRHCLAKGKYTPTTEIDHIRPLFKGGSDDRANLQGLCDECHRIKSAKDTGKVAAPRLVIGEDGWPI